MIEWNTKEKFGIFLTNRSLFVYIYKVCLNGVGDARAYSKNTFCDVLKLTVKCFSISAGTV